MVIKLLHFQIQTHGVHFLHFPIIGDETIRLLFDIRELGVDDKGKPLFFRGDDFLVEKLFDGVI